MTDLLEFPERIFNLTGLIDRELSVLHQYLIGVDRNSRSHKPFIHLEYEVLVFRGRDQGLLSCVIPAGSSA